MSNSGNWEKIASNVLRSELAKRGLSYNDLKDKLAIIGVNQSTNGIRSKMSRGRFMFTFFLQCMMAIGVEKVDLSDYFKIFRDN